MQPLDHKCQLFKRPLAHYCLDRDTAIQKVHLHTPGTTNFPITVPKVFYKWQLGANKGRSNYDPGIGIHCYLDLELLRRGSTPPTLEESMGEEGF